jgi:hypothetical protein
VLNHVFTTYQKLVSIGATYFLIKTTLIRACKPKERQDALMTAVELNDETLIVGYGALAQFLTERGYPVSKSLLSKLCSPAISQGPEIEGYWHRKPAFRRSNAITWAQARMRPAKRTPPLATAAPPMQPALSPSTAREQ